MTDPMKTAKHLDNTNYVLLIAVGIGTFIGVIIAIAIYNYLKPKGLKKFKGDSKNLKRILNLLASESESEEEGLLRRYPKKGNKQRRTRKDDFKYDRTHRVKAHKEKSTIRVGEREMRKARTPSFFERQNARRFPIIRICFTGGPCAGKTTAMTHCADQLRQLGIKTYIVPEAASILNKGGATLPKLDEDKEKAVKFQINLLKLQMALEDTLTDIGNDFYPEDKVVILCDMGTIDASVALTKELWDALLDETGWTEIQLRDKRYDMAIHMVTAADGAEEYFQRAGAESRSEDIENAIKIDRRTQQAWVGHPSF
jgi:thymidylate kinase